MKNTFLNSNELGLINEIPKLIANQLLGEDQLDIILGRYIIMVNNYDFSYEEWQNHFGSGMQPYNNGDSNTTSVTMKITHPIFKEDFKNKGAIGLDVPTWFNVKVSRPRIMLIAQDPLRSEKYYGECHDAVVSSPFGLHDATHREKPNGGKMVYELVKRLVDKDYGVYLTDANKYYVGNHKESNAYAKCKKEVYADILKKEIELVQPTLCVCLGRKAEQAIRRLGIEDALFMPHLSGAARGAIVKRYPDLKTLRATAENIADKYSEEIINKIKEIAENPAIE